MNRRLFLAFMSTVLIFPLCSGVLAHGQDKDDDDDKIVFRPPVLKPGEKPGDADFSCPYAKGYQHPERFAGFTLRLLPGPLRTKVPTDRCRATITSAKGTVTTAAKNWSLAVDKISGIDINGDVVHQNTADTDAVYGHDIPYARILSGAVATPPAAVHFVATVNELFRRGVEHRDAGK